MTNFPNARAHFHPPTSPTAYHSLYEAAPHADRAALVAALSALDGMSATDLLGLASAAGFARRLRSGTAAREALRHRVLERHDTFARVFMS